ncbi:hypothetical protein GGS21DRAFT_533696 [Xylaria nigripes]|nr:hypothetical protein GGS21DRAFT_533696 [Xylaria nigripes]
MATIAGVTGAQYVPGTEEFNLQNYQYATSTYGEERDLHPALIVQPKTKEDIALVLKYAKKKGIAVAIRTGGHQYSGASSTSAPNIQLDLRNSFKGPDDRVLFRKEGKAYVRTSVSWGLGDLNAWLAKNKAFVPHGQCTDVHLGGHIQTGGYGLLARSFGLLGDQILSLEIVDTDGNFKEVTKDSDPDLFWAFLGGSPGNLGVLTHVTLQAHQDEDYNGSRGLKALYFYDTETLKRLVNILVEMADNDDFPGNYDFCISVLSSSFPLLDLWPGLDETMARQHPELYGENGLIAWPRTIIVYAQWVPLKSGDTCDMSWFDRIKEGSDWILGENEVEEKPLSQLTGDWIFRNVREYEKPYVKRAYSTNSRTLSKDGFADWVVGRIDAIVSPDDNGCWLSGQLQCFGGKNSMFTRNATNGTSYSWRDTTLGVVLDCFHNTDALARAQDWQKVNDLEAIGPKGILSKQDRRFLWGSFGDWNLDANWNLYYEDQAKYDKLRQIRKAADPYGVFTANPFSVKRAE